MSECKTCGSKGEDSNPILSFKSGYIYVDGNYLAYDGWDDYNDEPDYNEAKINYCPLCGRKLE